MASTTASLRDRMAALSDEQVRAWKSSEGDILTGEVTLVDARTSQFTGKEEPVLHVRDDETGTEVAVYGSTQVLRDEIIRLAPQVGEQIALRRFTDGKSARHSYARFKLVVERDAEQEKFNWDRFGQSPTQEQSAKEVELYERRPEKEAPSYDGYKVPSQDADDSDLPF